MTFMIGGAIGLELALEVTRKKGEVLIIVHLHER